MRDPDKVPRRPHMDDIPTAKNDIFLDPTLPAHAATPGAIVRALPRRDRVPATLQTRYQNIQRIGAGGMGVVFRARDPRLGRDVALKLLKDGDAASWPRFLQEAQAQARVEHDHICRVYEVGETEDGPFIVMQLIEGEPLSIAKRSMPLRQRIELMRTVAFAVHAAHERGLVHRDLKPGNILVEKRADGSYRPYVVDFGLARDLSIHAEHHTLQGSIGTPGYMAPEAAIMRGPKILDVRVDVYSLGATLYDVIAGRPPYVDDHPWNILTRLGHEDPLSLSEVSKGISVELEAIVMKCLDRDPARRYPTAKALGEDLQRYLDGEPIEAKLAARTYVLRKKLRKHARAVALGLGMTALLAGFVSVRIRDQRAAAMQTEVAQDIGSTVKEMELYMRTAYQMPAHDIGRERADVRERIKTLEKGISEAGATNSAAARYALGRAYFAMGDDVLALEHLERAEALGYSSPELTYALSMAQLGTFAALKRKSEMYTAEPAALEADIKQLKQRYFEPALERLRNAEPARIEHPSYAAAQVAFHREEYATAVEKAREAFARAPLLYEAKRVEGEALVEMASVYWSSGKPDWFAQLSAGMERAFEAFAAAENIARSDPRIQMSICKARTRLMYASFSALPKIPLPLYDAAKKACDRLVEIDPESVDGHLTRAQMHSLYAHALAETDEPDGDPAPPIAEAVRLSEEAKRLSPGGLVAYEALGLALSGQTKMLLTRGRDASRPLEAAQRNYAEACATFRHHAGLRDGYMFMHYRQSLWERRRGIDASPHIDQVNKLVDQSIAAKSSVAMAYEKRALVYLSVAEQKAELGDSPKAEVDAALEALTSAATVNAIFKSPDKEVRAYLPLARHALASGISARDALDQATKSLEALRAKDPDDVMTKAMTGRVALMEAEERIRLGADPRAMLESARKAFRTAMKLAPWEIDLAIYAAHVELESAKFALEKGQATAATFEAIRSPLQSWMTDALVHPEPYALVAAAHALAAEWRASRRESPNDDVAAGLAMVDKALAIHPKYPLALEMQKRLQKVRDGAVVAKN